MTVDADGVALAPAPAAAAARLDALETWHFWFVGRDQLVATLLQRFRTEGLVVDVGCGTGRFAASLHDTGTEVVALDRSIPSPAAPGAIAVGGDAEALPLRTGSVSVVLARDVLEHVDDARALREARRVLEPGGLLVALVPAWPALWSRRDERAGHRRRYTRASLRRVLTEAGFHIVELRGYQLVLLPLAAASRIAARRRPAAQLRAEESPSPLVNRVLTRVNRAEARLASVSWARPPTGSTLVAVARRS